MSAIKEILNSIRKLSCEDQKYLKSLLLNEFAVEYDMDEFVAEERFANGQMCPRCGGVHIVCNGHRKDGTQRYMCKDCKRSFIATTNSIVAGTKKDLRVWEKYISCMMAGMPIRQTAETCGIHRNTAFYWRHKILDALQDRFGKVELDGIVEVDETFFTVSYKGDHKRSKVFSMPREVHKRGKAARLHGLSREKVCVPCAISRNGSSFARVANLGRISTNSLDEMFRGKITDGATLVTDKASAYIRFAENNGLKLVQLKSGVGNRGVYNVQRINSYHSKLKRFIRGFNGVSTKYLNNYLAWNNFVNCGKETVVEKQNILLRCALTAVMKLKCTEVSSRPPIPMLG